MLASSAGEHGGLAVCVEWSNAPLGAAYWAGSPHVPIPLPSPLETPLWTSWLLPGPEASSWGKPGEQQPSALGTRGVTSGGHTGGVARVGYGGA